MADKFLLGFPVSEKTADSELYQDGTNIGINETNPQRNLEISATTDAGIRLTSTGNGLGAASTIGAIEYYGNDASTPGAGIKAAIKAVTEASLGDDSALVFSNSDGTTNNVERMRINSAGNVGIGTDSPSQKLEVYGASPNILINNTAETNAALLFQDSADAGQSAAIKYNSSSNTLGFFNHSSNTERMRINSSGNVGIGTTSPSNTLHVNSGSTNEVAKFESTDGAAYISLKDSTTTHGLQGIGSIGDALVMYSNNGERMRIRSNGVINFANMPTSSTGLSSGDVWSDGGTLKIVS